MQGIQALLIFHPLVGKRSLRQGELAALQGLVHLVGAHGRPAVAAEGNADAPGRRQTAHVAEKRRHRGHHRLVERRRTHGDVARIQHLSHDIGDVVHLQIEQARGNAYLDEGLGDLRGHGLGGVPHGIVDHERVLLGDAAAPLLVHLQDLRHMAAPDDAVGRGDHIEGKTGERL